METQNTQRENPYLRGKSNTSRDPKHGMFLGV